LNTSSFNQILCPYCGSSQNNPSWSGVDEYGDSFSTQICQRCGTGFLFPPPSETQLANAYSVDYYGAGQEKFGGVVEKFRDFAARSRAKKLSRLIQPGAKILDVGCGDGRFLSCLRAVGSYELHGIEMPGPAAERSAQNPEIRLYTGDLLSAPYPEASFDLISMVHVIEHLFTPSATLDKIEKLLKPGGILFIAYPNITSWQARWAGPRWFHLDPPRHLSLIPPDSLAKLLARKDLPLLACSHLSYEQNIYGWIQSLLNILHNPRNHFYNRIKHRDWNKSPLLNSADIILAGVSLPLAIIADLCAAIARSGATVEQIYKKNV
jgi:SAM-dependent methyltransferase